MYLVDLGSGKETIFRSGADLAEAIRQGVVGEQCRIYHRARATWLPITAHPEYRRIMARHPAHQLPPAPRRQWTFMRVEDGDPVAAFEPPPPPQDANLRPPAARSWRQSLGSAFRFWDKASH
jgi:hypothetical protein